MCKACRKRFQTIQPFIKDLLDEGTDHAVICMFYASDAVWYFLTVVIVGDVKEDDSFDSTATMMLLNAALPFNGRLEGSR
jgi:hypothetical protein